MKVFYRDFVWDTLYLDLDLQVTDVCQIPIMRNDSYDSVTKKVQFLICNSNDPSSPFFFRVFVLLCFIQMAQMLS